MMRRGLELPPDAIEAIDAIRVGVRLTEDQIRMLILALAPPGGGYSEDPLRRRTQTDLSIWLAVLLDVKRAARLALAGMNEP